MAKFLIIFALLIGVLSQSPIPISPEDEALFNGFMNGSQLWSALPDFAGCGGNSTSILDSLSRASAYFRRSPLTSEDVEGGVREIGLAVEAVGLVVRKCTSIPTKFNNIYNFFNNIINNSTYFLEQTGLNILKNAYPIFTDLRDINEVYSQGNFYEFGRRLGEVARFLFSVQFPQVRKFLN
jgi:hypothetical protein